MAVAASGAGAAGSGAAAAAIQAVKASGVIVRLTTEEFRKLLALIEDPLIVTSTTSFLGTRYHYLTSYRGLAFYTKSKEPVEIGMAEVIAAKRIWVPT